MFLRQCITSIATTVATLFMSPLSKNWSGWEKMLNGIHRKGLLVLLSLLYSRYPLMSLYKGHKYLLILYPFWRSTLIHICSPYSCVINSLKSWAKRLMSVHEWHIFIPVDSLSSIQSKPQDVSLEVIPTGKIFLTYLPLLIFQDQH